MSDTQLSLGEDVCILYKKREKISEFTLHYTALIIRYINQVDERERVM